MNKKYLLIVLILVVAALVFWKMKDKTPTGDSQSYTNNELGISFEYPEGVTITKSVTDEPGVTLHFPNDQYQFNIIQPMGGIEGFSTKITGYDDKVITSNKESRMIRDYDTPGASDSVQYFVPLAGDGSPHQTWIALSFIERSRLNQSIVDNFDQIASSFKVTQ